MEDEGRLDPSCQQTGSWNDPRSPCMPPALRSLPAVSGDMRQFVDGGRPFIHPFVCLENLLSAYDGPGTVLGAVCKRVCVRVCSCAHVCVCMCVEQNPL